MSTPNPCYSYTAELYMPFVIGIVTTFPETRAVLLSEGLRTGIHYGQPVTTKIWLPAKVHIAY